MRIVHHMDKAKRIWGRNIRITREELQLSQIDLAALLNVTQPTVSRWELGLTAPKDVHRVALAKVLEQEIGVLFPMGDVA